jgi:MoaA/NifB/PqqE/SkfB family radical SAM enzyme
MIVLWRVTQRCNLACGFCAYDRRLGGERQETDLQQVERVGVMLAEHRRITGERVLLSWLGGEPLLWRPVFEISRRLHNEHGIDISATTNGSTLHQGSTVDAILASFCELTVSVDGLASFHDQVRGCIGAWHRLQRAVRQLAWARDAHAPALKLRTNVVLMRDNLEDFSALCLELSDWGIDEITFNQLGGRDRPEFFPAHRLRPADVQALQNLLPSLRDRLTQNGVRLCANEPYLQRLHASAEDRPIDGGDCAPGERLLFIDEFGRMAPCSFTSPSYGVALTDLQPGQGLAALRAHFRAARLEAPSPACRDCHATHVFSKFESRP